MGKSIFIKISLIFIGIMIGLIIAEIILRFTRPDFSYLVNSDYVENKFRIHNNPKAVKMKFTHPDTGVEHFRIYNSLGFRQSREFLIKKHGEIIRIGVFGDSFTENLGMPVQYSFSEPLDFLLNSLGKGSFEVMNFGTSGYGTDQVYLQYLDEGIKLDLDIIIYMYYKNDLRDILSNNLFEIDESGKLNYIYERRTSLIKKIVKKFYLTYFVLKAMPVLSDIKEKAYYYLSKLSGPARAEKKNQKKMRNLALFHHQSVEDPDLMKSLQIFTEIIKKMRKLAVQNSSHFYVAMVPNPTYRKMTEHYRRLQEKLKQIGVESIDLISLFDKEKQTPRASEFFFQKDGHWNEEANRIAAIFLFKFLTGKLSMENTKNGFIKENLNKYYASFSPANGSSSWLEENEAPDPTKKLIREKYLFLE